MVGDIMQPTHLLFVLVVALLVLGPKRLPEVGRTLGSGIRDFRQALSGEHDHRESEYVTAAQTPAEQHDQPAPMAVDHDDADASWHDEAIGPATFDEPVSFDTDADPEHDTPGEPASEIHDPADTDTEIHIPSEPVTAVHDSPDPATDVDDSPDPATAVHDSAEPATEVHESPTPPAA